LFWNRRYQRRRKIDPLKRLGAGKSTDQISKNLYQAALDAGARVEFGKKISKVDVERAASVLEDGITVARGLVVGADGQTSPVNLIPLLLLLTPSLQGL
jgi:2-polyprenyl-6-methoxyphenol hydroxylase-like FAD-dependent oxidoreductase